MRLSSSSEEIATASTSRSVKSAKFFTAAPFHIFRMVLNCIRGGRGEVKSFGSARRAQELQKQPVHLRRLFLLYPVPGAVDQMAADHVRACRALHGLKHAGALVGAPILLAGDEAGGDLDGLARPGLEFGGKRAGCV